jgi:hypothetical protein
LQAEELQVSCEGWLLEDSEPPPELEGERLPLPELLEDGASSPPAAIAGAKNLLPLLLSFVSIFSPFCGLMV